MKLLERVNSEKASRKRVVIAQQWLRKRNEHDVKFAACCFFFRGGFTQCTTQTQHTIRRNSLRISRFTIDANVCRGRLNRSSTSTRTENAREKYYIINISRDNFFTKKLIFNAFESAWRIVRRARIKAYYTTFGHDEQTNIKHIYLYAEMKESRSAVYYNSLGRWFYQHQEVSSQRAHSDKK